MSSSSSSLAGGMGASSSSVTGGVVLAGGNQLGAAGGGAASSCVTGVTGGGPRARRARPVRPLVERHGALAEALARSGPARRVPSSRRAARGPRSPCPWPAPVNPRDDLLLDDLLNNLAAQQPASRRRTGPGPARSSPSRARPVPRALTSPCARATTPRPAGASSRAPPASPACSRHLDARRCRARRRLRVRAASSISSSICRPVSMTSDMTVTGPA